MQLPAKEVNGEREIETLKRTCIRINVITKLVFSYSCCNYLLLTHDQKPLPEHYDYHSKCTRETVSLGNLTHKVAQITSLKARASYFCLINDLTLSHLRVLKTTIRGHRME